MKQMMKEKQRKDMQKKMPKKMPPKEPMMAGNMMKEGYMKCSMDKVK